MSNNNTRPVDPPWHTALISHHRFGIMLGSEIGIVQTNGLFEIHSQPVDFLAVKAALEERGVKLSSAEVGYVPTNKVEISDAGVGRKVLRLLEGLEDHDDVQGVHANYSFTSEVTESIAREL